MERVDPDGELAGVDASAPASLYYAHKPGWWPSGAAWPWVGPDLTPMVGSLPAKSRSASFDYYTSSDFELHPELRQLLLQRRGGVLAVGAIPAAVAIRRSHGFERVATKPSPTSSWRGWIRAADSRSARRLSGGSSCAALRAPAPPPAARCAVNEDRGHRHAQAGRLRTSPMSAAPGRRSEFTRGRNRSTAELPRAPASPRAAGRAARSTPGDASIAPRRERPCWHKRRPASRSSRRG